MRRISCRNALEEAIDPVLAMIGIGKELWKQENGDSFIRREREETGWMAIAESQRADVGRAGEASGGNIPHTATRKSLRYIVDGNGVFFERDGRRVNQRMARTDFDKAVSRLPLRKTTDIESCFDFAYLFGLLTDSGIMQRMGFAASSRRSGNFAPA
jgi:hypothetical protein